MSIVLNSMGSVLDGQMCPRVIAATELSVRDISSQVSPEVLMLSFQSPFISEMTSLGE